MVNALADTLKSLCTQAIIHSVAIMTPYLTAPPSVHSIPTPSPPPCCPVTKPGLQWYVVRHLDWDHEVVRATKMMDSGKDEPEDRQGQGQGVGWTEASPRSPPGHATPPPSAWSPPPPPLSSTHKRFTAEMMRAWPGNPKSPLPSPSHNRFIPDMMREAIAYQLKKQ